VAKAAQEVAKLATAASKGEAGLVAGALVGALNNFVLKGISSPEVRAVLSAAVESGADSIDKRGSLKGYGLGGARKGPVNAAAKGEAGLVAGALVGALNNFVLKGISSPEVRAVLSAAVESVADSIAKRGSLKGYGLGDAAKDALKAAAKPLATLVSKNIANER